MKKLFLLTAAALVGFNAGAQQAEQSMLSGARQAIGPKIAGNHQPGAKSTIAGSRWYHHGAFINSIVLPNQMDWGFVPIWFDSTVTQMFIDGPGTINFSSISQVVDPIHFTLYNDVNTYPGANDIAITPESPYEIDSIAFGAFYVTNPARSQDIIDTFIISVSSSGNNQETPFLERYPSYPNFTNNGYVDVTTTDTMIKGFRIEPVDDINRASGVNNVVMWKVPIDTTMRRPDSLGYIFYKSFVYPVMVNGSPGSASIPAGRTAGITVTFKSGDVINEGDSFNHYHHVYMSTGEGLGEGQTNGTAMPYFHYQHRDQNMSGLMFSWDPTAYGPAVVIEGRNTIDFRYEFHDIEAHVVCNDCPTVAEYSSVRNINSALATDMVAYPNPANNEIKVSFIMAQNTSANVTITNAVGQVVATQQVANVIAKQNNVVSFSTANFAPGVYFYTVEAQGQRTTSRFVVSH